MPILRIVAEPRPMEPSETDCFLDTNILIYWISDGSEKKRIATDLVTRGGVISVQVLNEFISVCRKPDRNVPWHLINLALAGVHQSCRVIPLTVQDQASARALSEKHHLPIYEACIVAGALTSKCKLLMTEDFQHGRQFGNLTIINPFRPH